MPLQPTEAQIQKCKFGWSPHCNCCPQIKHLEADCVILLRVCAWYPAMPLGPWTFLLWIRHWPRMVKGVEGRASPNKYWTHISRLTNPFCTDLISNPCVAWSAGAHDSTTNPKCKCISTAFTCILPSTQRAWHLREQFNGFLFCNYLSIDPIKCKFEAVICPIVLYSGMIWKLQRRNVQVTPALLSRACGSRILVTPETIKQHFQLGGVECYLQAQGSKNCPNWKKCHGQTGLARVAWRCLPPSSDQC